MIGISTDSYRIRSAGVMTPGIPKDSPFLEFGENLRMLIPIIDSKCKGTVVVAFVKRGSWSASVLFPLVEIDAKFKLVCRL